MKGRRINLVHRYPRLFIAITGAASLYVLFGRLVYNMFRSYSDEEVALYNIRKQEIKERVKRNQELNKQI